MQLPTKPVASQLREFHLVDDELVGILRGWIPACQRMPREDGNRELVRSDVDRRWPTVPFLRQAR